MTTTRLLRTAPTALMFAWFGLGCQSTLGQPPERIIDARADYFSPDDLCNYCLDYTDAAVAVGAIVTSYIPGSGYERKEKPVGIDGCNNAEKNNCQRAAAIK